MGKEPTAAADATLSGTRGFLFVLLLLGAIMAAVHGGLFY
jgi:hypothetical protein